MAEVVLVFWKIALPVAERVPVKVLVALVVVTVWTFVEIVCLLPVDVGVLPEVVQSPNAASRAGWSSAEEHVF